MTNFGGQKENGKSPEQTASKELEEKSLGFYQISPEKLKKCVHYDFCENKKCFRTYYVLAEYFGSGDLVRKGRDFAIKSQYKGAEYNDIKDKYKTDLNNYKIKRIHDYLENNAFAWISVSKLHESIEHGSVWSDSGAFYGKDEKPLDLENIPNKYVNQETKPDYSLRKMQYREFFVKSTKEFLKHNDLEKIFTNSEHKLQSNDVTYEQVMEKIKNEFEEMNKPKEMIAEQPLNIGGFENQKTGTGGTNTSLIGTYNGVKYRIKMVQRYNSFNEKLASELYKAAGCKVFDFKLVSLKEEDFEKYSKKIGDKLKFFTNPEDKTMFVASPFVENFKTMDNLKAKNIQELSGKKEIQNKEILDNFVIDAWLGNYDVIGIPEKNCQAVNIGFLDEKFEKPVRHDIGGSLQSKAQGGKKGKGFNENAKEFEFLLGDYESSKDILGLPYHKEISDASFYIFKNIQQENFENGMNKLKEITDEKIKEIVNKYGDPKQKTENDLRSNTDLADLLIKRRDAILKKTWLDVKNALGKHQ